MRLRSARLLLSGPWGEARDESRAGLRWAGYAVAGLPREPAEADDAHRVSSDSVARDEVLRPFGPSRLHPVPGLSGRRRQALLPHLRRVRVERLRAIGRRQEARAGGGRYR